MNTIDQLAQPPQPPPGRFTGVTIGTVRSVKDLLMQGRVKLTLPSVPGIEPWARVATLMSGSEVGTYYVPQEGDEVLVAFAQGDVREPYVLGSLRNGQDTPPIAAPTDAFTLRKLKTPHGHVVVFDDATGEIRIETATEQTVHLTPEGVLVKSGGKGARFEMDATGNVTFDNVQKFSVKALDVQIEASASLALKGTASATMESSGMAKLTGATVSLN